jgi:hypothetical protein
MEVFRLPSPLQIDVSGGSRFMYPTMITALDEGPTTSSEQAIAGLQTIVFFSVFGRFIRKGESVDSALIGTFFTAGLQIDKIIKQIGPSGIITLDRRLPDIEL